MAGRVRSAPFYQFVFNRLSTPGLSRKLFRGSHGTLIAYYIQLHTTQENSFTSDPVSISRCPLTSSINKSVVLLLFLRKWVNLKLEPAWFSFNPSARDFHVHNFVASISVHKVHCYPQFSHSNAVNSCAVSGNPFLP